MSRRWFYALFFLLPLTAVLGHRGLAPWLLLASFPAFARGDFWQAAFGKVLDHPSLNDSKFAGFLALLFLCFWIGLSAAWSPKHQPDLFLYVLGPALVGGSVVWFSLHLTREWAWRLGRAFLIAMIGGMIVLSIEGVTGGFLRGLVPPTDVSPGGSRDSIALGRGVTALVPALFPAAAIAARLWSRTAAALTLALGVAAAASNDVAANAVAVGIGFAVALTALAAPRSTLRAAGWSALGALALFPAAAALIPVDAVFAYAADNLSAEAQAAASSSLHRLAVWKAAADQAFACLPFGCGGEYARVWKETAPHIAVPGAGAALSLMPTHPHNVFLQIWLELGLPGVAAFGAFIYLGVKTLLAARLSKAVTAAAGGAFAAILVSLTVEASLWQVWRLAAMGLAASGVALAHALEKR